MSASERVASGLLASVPSSPMTLLAALPDEGGAVLTEDHGGTFVPARGLSGRTIETLATPARASSIVYAGALPQSVATTTDGGSERVIFPSFGRVAWTERLTLGLGLSGVRVRDVVADPHDPTVVWAVDDLSALKISGTGQQVERLAAPFGFGASRLAVASSTPATIYLVGNESCALQKSTDAGATWSCPGLAPLGIPPRARVLEVDPRNANIVHLVDDSGRLFRSLDGAQSWQSVPTSFEVTALAIDPLDGATLYAGTEGDGIWKSLDHGSSWFLLGDALNGLPLNTNAVTDLLAHPLDSDRLYVSYASGGTRGVFETVDGGATFHQMGFGWGEAIPCCFGLPRELVSGPLAVDSRLPSIVYAGTWGAGVWRAVHEERAACIENDRTLCLGGGRFRVQARWRDFKGRSGPGHAIRLTPDTGYFWFFEPDNLELMVKALDGRAINERFWIFYGALSNVEFQMLVTDTETGQIDAYFNPERQFASRGDTSAFPRAREEAVRTVDGRAADLPLELSAALGASATHIPLTAPIAARANTLTRPVDTVEIPSEDDALHLADGRFRVTVEWRNFKGKTGVGHARPLNDTTGTFWFFEPENLEIAIKVLDGRAINGRFWVFYGALSNVEYRIRVEDTATGEVRTYFNPSGQFASRGDTAAFPVQ
jgi:hypothetical protein